MRGKKTDSQFLTDFITDCAGRQCSTPDEMIAAAEQEINQINDQIKKVEQLKVRRSKLLDVIAAFKEPQKASKEEVRILSFFQIQNPHICKFICDTLRTAPCGRDKLNSHQYSNHDINFCIKQLLEQRVIAKMGESLLRGEMFDEYSKFVLQEV